MSDTASALGRIALIKFHSACKSRGIGYVPTKPSFMTMDDRWNRGSCLSDDQTRPVKINCLIDRSIVDIFYWQAVDIYVCLLILINLEVHRLRALSCRVTLRNIVTIVNRWIVHVYTNLYQCEYFRNYLYLMIFLYVSYIVNPRVFQIVLSNSDLSQTVIIPHDPLARLMVQCLHNANLYDLIARRFSISNES